MPIEKYFILENFLYKIAITITTLLIDSDGRALYVEESLSSYTYSMKVFK